MQRIQKFKADDGAEFTTEAACLKHEALCAEISEVMASLPKRPNDDGCRFFNGHGYRLTPHKWFEQALANKRRTRAGAAG